VTRLNKSLLAKPGRFTRTLSQEVQLCPADVGMTVHLDFLNSRRTKHESTFNTYTIRGDTAHGKAFLVTGFSHTYHGASNKLDPVALALDDPQMHGHTVSRP
jgi:hypothetical protein